MHSLQPLSPAEEQVMFALWQLPAPVQRIDLQKALAPRCRWAAPTLLNFLYRMEQKGYVRSEKQGNRNLYTPLIRRQDYAAARFSALLEGLCGGSLCCLVDILENSGRLDLPAMEALRSHLDTLIAESPEYSDYYDTWQ